VGKPVCIGGQRANRLKRPPSIQKNNDRRDQQKYREKSSLKGKPHKSLIILMAIAREPRIDCL
jgi:hypothetical protein